MMNTMSVAHAKAHLSELLKAVESGEEVVITRHGRPIAREQWASELAFCPNQPLPLHINESI